MLDVRTLPAPGEQPPRHVHAPRARLYTWAKVLANPTTVSCHWSTDQRISVPHTVPVCPLCVEHGRQVQYGQSYFPALVAQLSDQDGQPGDWTHWHEWCLMLPQDVAADLQRDRRVGTNWRGATLKLTKSKPSAPLVAWARERGDVIDWPAPWDVSVDLRHCWREYLRWAALYQPDLTQYGEQEPQEVG